MLSISKSLGLNRKKPIIIPTEKCEENSCPLPQSRAFLFQALRCRMVTRTHYQKMLLAAKKRVYHTGIAIKPEEWRLPKAPVPSRPDFSRSLVKRPVRNVSTDSNVRDDTKEDEINDVTDSVLLLVPNNYFISAFPTSGQHEPPKLYTSICNQKILHERQPQFIQRQKEESISEDENLTKANFEDYRQILSPEGTTEESLVTTDFERKEAILMKRFKYSTGAILSTKFHQEAYYKANGTRLPFSHPYSYVRINSSPRIAERRNQWKLNMKNSVKMAKFLRIWNRAPEYTRPHEKKNGQSDQMEVTGNTGTLFVKKSAKKEIQPKRKITKLKKQRPQLKVEMNKYFNRINEDTGTVSGLDDDRLSMSLSEDVSQMDKSPSLPDLTRLNDKAKPKKQKLSKRTKKHKRSKFQLKICETAEAPITPEELLEINEPRDFLTKYCIIHPNRLSIYERVFQKSVSMQTPKFTRRTQLPSRQAPLALKEVSVGELVSGGEGDEGPTEESRSDDFIRNGSIEEEEGDDDEEEDNGDEEDEDEEEEEEDEDDSEEGSLEGENYDEEDDEDETERNDDEENREDENGNEKFRKEPSAETGGVESGLLLNTTGQTYENVEMVQPNSPMEQHMDYWSGKAFLCQRELSDIGLTMPERSLRKLHATSEILMDSWNDLLIKKNKLEDEKRQLVIEKARELFPEGLDTNETQRQEDVTLQTVVMEACGFKIPEEITDESILRHMTDSKMEQIKADLGEILNSIDTKIEIIQDKMQLTSKDMQVLEDVTENLHNYCYEYCTFGPPDTRPVSSRFRRQQSFIYNKLRPEKDLELNFSELEPTLQQVNKALLTKKHCQYIYYILKVSECCRINFRLFSVLAALSEKVTQLEPMVQNLIEKLDFDALDVKIKHSKELFNLLRTDDLLPGDLTTVTNLSFELAAGGINPADAALVMKKLSRDAAGYVDFLDFVTYIPLFVEIHEKIITNPLRSNIITNLCCVSGDTHSFPC